MPRPSSSSSTGIADRDHLGRRALVAAVLIVLMTAGAVSAAGLLKLDDIVSGFSDENVLSSDVKTDESLPGKPQTIMALGTDGRLGADAGGGQRSDTILLARLDADNRVTTLTSIPRDLKVQIPGYGVDKINAAYSLGGTALTVKTVKALLSTPGRPFKINHVVEINFTGFRDLVDYFGCVYVDVDRRYFNDVGGPLGYATIDIPAGYQKLCGSDALDYVRYRHTDSDLVRGARQQDFLRQMLRQPQVRAKLTFSRAKALVRLASKFTRLDKGLRNTKQLITLLKLGLGVSARPIAQIPFGGKGLYYSLDNGASYVNAPPDAVARTVRAFLHPAPPKAPKRRVKRTRSSGLSNFRSLGEQQAANLTRKPRMPFYVPALGLSKSAYADPEPRVYTLHGKPAYRLSLKVSGQVGAYYGVQGMKWRSPPILDGPHKDTTVQGRKLSVYLDGSKVSMVVWRTRGGVYWVHNTLTHDLSRAQMLAIARSLVRQGAR